MKERKKQKKKTFILGRVPLQRQTIYVQQKKVCEALDIHAFSFPLQITTA